MRKEDNSDKDPADGVVAASADKIATGGGNGGTKGRDRNGQAPLPKPLHTTKLFAEVLFCGHCFAL